MGRSGLSLAASHFTRWIGQHSASSMTASAILVCKHFLPGVDNASLREEVEIMTGVRR